MFKFPVNVQSAALISYANQAEKYPRLTHEEEKTATPEQLINSNLRLVMFAARKWARNPEEMLDRVQDGNLGLITAARRFDPSHGVHFATFAMYHILNCVRNGTRTSERVVVTSQRAFRLYSQVKALLEQKTQHEEIAERLGLTVAEIVHLFKYEEVKEDGIHEEFWSDGGMDIDWIHVVAKAEKVLDEREYDIITSRLAGFSCEEIAGRYGFSRSMTWNIEREAITKLQRALRVKKSTNGKLQPDER